MARGGGLNNGNGGGPAPRRRGAATGPAAAGPAAASEVKPLPGRPVILFSREAEGGLFELGLTQMQPGEDGGPDVEREFAVKRFPMSDRAGSDAYWTALEQVQDKFPAPAPADQKGQPVPPTDPRPSADQMIRRGSGMGGYGGGMGGYGRGGMGMGMGRRRPQQPQRPAPRGGGRGGELAGEKALEDFVDFISGGKKG